jgi:hypothetical protein
MTAMIADSNRIIPLSGQAERRIRVADRRVGNTVGCTHIVLIWSVAATDAQHDEHVQSATARDGTDQAARR